MIEVKNTLNGKLNASIVREYPELEEITVTPTLDGQELKPSKYGYSKVVVKKIQATDVTVSPTEEEQNLQGIFKEVKVSPILTEEITTDLDFSTGDSIELTAQEGAYIKKATINKDANLSPENIKSGVTIAGVSGDVADTSDADATSEDIVAGKTAYVNNQKVVGVAEINNNNALFDTSLSNGSASYPGISKNLKTLVGDFTSGSDASFMFTNLSNLESIKGTLDTSKATNMQNAFAVCKKLVEVPELDTRNVSNMTNIFANCSSLKTVNLPRTENVTNFFQAFQGCSSLESVVLGDTSKAINTKYMFQNCVSLQNVSDMNLSSLTDLGAMFYGCSSLETAPNLTLNVNSGVSINALFRSCTNLKNVPIYNTIQVTSMVNAFDGCENLTYESINNILLMCANATSYTGTKTLMNMGLYSNYYDSATIQGLSNYQAFLDAGWTTGY